MRMSVNTFDYLSEVAGRLKKERTSKHPISVCERQVVTTSVNTIELNSTLFTGNNIAMLIGFAEFMMP